ncbi:BAF_HP2_G0030030.mRNA.1.CDS.1 [Saccharomyces cerevisiae]|nr:BAF_HP2_G0030030.mRNA.1.CDS.1 [Saccharomyces cerevisiae]CAI6454414.1 BAF_HP2_G0030030.mRNA.1.CDS.1 [Saccharomyces cerevisiae]
MWVEWSLCFAAWFTLAAALSKYNIAKVLSTHILASAGTNPHFILLTNMFVALFGFQCGFLMLLPPVLAILLFNLACEHCQEIVSMPKFQFWYALASNIGGMSSPIASPQNIFSIGIRYPSPFWAEWFMIALPVCFICVMAIWVLLIITFLLSQM